MEAPEKIYIIPHTLTDGFCHRWFEEPFKTECIEYVRKDAFVKKACEWLINHNDYICCSTNGIVKYYMKQLVEDFKKYMEG